MDVLRGWLRHQPLAVPAAGLMAGILLDARWPLPFLLAPTALLLAGTALLRAGRTRILTQPALLFAALATGAGLHHVDFRRIPSGHIVSCVHADGTPARLTARVVTKPFIHPRRTNRITWFQQIPRTRLLVEAETLEGTSADLPVCGLVAVSVAEPLLGISAGDRVELFGTLRLPRPPVNPGERDRSLVSRRNGIRVEMSCPHAGGVKRLDAGRNFASLLNRLRRCATAAMHEQAFDEGAAGSHLLDALVLGQRSAVDEDLNQAFINTGTVHYLSVSGAHVGALISGVWLIGWLLGLDRRKCALGAAGTVVLYAILAESSPAVTRAAIMAVTFCIAIHLRRPVRSVNSLSAAALVLLVLQPTQLFDPGFQLSFLTLAALMFLAPRLHASCKRIHDRLLRRDDPLLQPAIQRILNPPTRTRRICNACLSRLAWAFSLSVSAWLVGTLVGMYHFRQAAPWGWLNTVLIILPMDLLLLLGLGKTIVSALVPEASFLAGWPLRVLTTGLIEFVRLLNRLPASGLYCPEIPSWLAAAAITWLGLWVVAAPLRIRGRWTQLALLALLAGSACSLRPPATGGSLRMHVLAVGDGTACILQLPDGSTLVYDLGTRPPYDLHRWTVGPFLAHQRIRTIRALIVSHAQLDHFSGIPDLIDHADVQEVLTTPHFLSLAGEPGPAGRLISDLRARDLPWRTLAAGRRVEGTGDTIVEVLWPPPPESLEIRNINDTSLVLRITCAGRRILLCGDIEEWAQRRLIAAADLSADVLVLPHHGAIVRSTADFLKSVNAACCIRSSGRRDLESSGALVALLDGRRYYNTAECGAVEVCIGAGDAGDIRVNPWRR